VVSYQDTPSALRILNIVRTMPEAAGDRAHDRRQRHRALRAPARPRSPSDRGFADARQPCAGAGRRADAARLRRVQEQRDARYGLLRGYFTAPTTTPLTSCSMPGC
jgi:hypothetical protein